MRITEHDRHQLYRRLTDVIGPDEADTLMELLPPVGWADVATKPDLQHQTALADVRFDAIDHRLEQIDRRFAQVDERFEQIDRRFAQVDQRFEQMDQRFEQMDRRIASIEHGLVQHDARFDRIDVRLDMLGGSIEHLATTTDLKFQTIESRFIGELHRTMRVNLLVTIGVLGTLITLMAGISSGL